MINKVIYYVNGVNCDENYFYEKLTYLININHFTYSQFTYYLQKLDKNNIITIPYLKHNKYGTPQQTLISYQFERVIIKN